MSAVATESARELRRSGGFELIFPVAGTAHKYLKFFEGPRPLERMLATTPASSAQPAGRRETGSAKTRLRQRVHGDGRSGPDKS